jgi:hypothetical protein
MTMSISHTESNRADDKKRERERLSDSRTTHTRACRYVRVSVNLRNLEISENFGPSPHPEIWVRWRPGTSHSLPHPTYIVSLSSFQRAATSGGAKLSLKDLGERWRAVPEAEKEAIKARAAQVVPVMSEGKKAKCACNDPLTVI